MRKNTYKPLSISEILAMSDDDFVDRVFERNNFSLKGKNRRFKYRTTNEQVDELTRYLDVKKSQDILSVSGSGVQLFEILTDPAKMPGTIFAFDYSPKQVAYNYLLKTGIRELTFEVFRVYFGLGNIKNKGVQ